MDSNNIMTLSNRYESVLNAQMTKPLGNRIVNLYYLTNTEHRRDIFEML